MQITLIFLVMSLFAALWLRSLPRKQRGPAAIRLSLIVGTVIVVVLAVTGRLHFLFAFLALLYPLLRRVLPSLLTGGLTGGGAKARPGNQSHVSSEVLDMSLDHDSGTMDGTILTGPMAGRTLSDLGESEFLELLRYCRAQDEDSARLLETYLDRRFGDSWRADDEAGSNTGGSGESGSGSSASGPLTESEALDILGLEPGASREEIIQAHRRMMQKVHPDHGGSNYLAARINEAKECLLG